MVIRGIRAGAPSCASDIDSGRACHCQHSTVDRLPGRLACDVRFRRGGKHPARHPGRHPWPGQRGRGRGRDRALSTAPHKTVVAPRRRPALLCPGGPRRGDRQRAGPCRPFPGREPDPVPGGLSRRDARFHPARGSEAARRGLGGPSRRRHPDGRHRPGGLGRIRQSDPQLGYAGAGRPGRPDLVPAMRHRPRRRGCLPPPGLRDRHGLDSPVRDQRHRPAHRRWPAAGGRSLGGLVLGRREHRRPLRTLGRGRASPEHVPAGSPQRQQSPPHDAGEDRDPRRGGHGRAGDPRRPGPGGHGSGLGRDQPRRRPDRLSGDNLDGRTWSRSRPRRRRSSRRSRSASARPRRRCGPSSTRRRWPSSSWTATAACCSGAAPPSSCSATRPRR